ncbi:hypothetical protein DRW07_10190 [Alteromonas sediminis]|uniref:Sulfotransferase domain-containing protein n=1 Tax=Alteromonas sediminis TaxID=2259342 RepID=A0A3N5YBN8_9ALTE|nr:sulfotransferase domain-containing protein [Alteromonas sediminis]RPJ66455.1 hypothetical protein DRW07_10190 [Alteromonas sediminis]
MQTDTFILFAGIPRSGTTLTCHLLNQIPCSHALIESMDMDAFLQCENAQRRATFITDYLTDTYSNIQRQQPILINKIDQQATNTFAESPAGEKRKNKIVAKVPTVITQKLDNHFSLVLKHPNAFSALLDELTTSFTVFAQIRNPLSVIASWNSLDHPLSRGHAPMAEAFDENLHATLSAVSDDLDRQLLLLDWYYKKFKTILPKDKIIRYEDIIKTGGKALSSIVPGADKLNEHLEDRNANALYNIGLIEAAYAKLKASPEHACWRFYNEQEVEQTLFNAKAAEAQKQRLDFMIIGAQKCGTTALASFLSEHSNIAIPAIKEVHLFDSEDYQPGMSTEAVNTRYAIYFDDRFKHRAASSETLFGEATPFYLFCPEIVKALHDYNPDLKVIIQIRDPVERAISHYQMEKNRKAENRSIAFAFLFEPLRLGRIKPWLFTFARRTYSYLSRGKYYDQICIVRQYFNDDQILIVDNTDLLTSHDTTVQQVFTFLNIPAQKIAPREVFKTDNRPTLNRALRLWLKWVYRRPNQKLKRLLRAMGYPVPTWLES